ncbi:hypothetical protein [Sphingomonas sp.]|uniref:hypothetical protein n=1 Tax=Sphingomonas sp. TaxID=28214 RepID=UPI003D6D573B
MFCALLVTIGFATADHAVAQTKLINTPAEKFIITPGGVDLRTGRYAYDTTDLTIGGEGGLKLNRIMSDYVGQHANPFGNFSHNWDIMLVETRVGLSQGTPVGSDFRANVHSGGRSLTFESNLTQDFYIHKTSGPSALLTFAGGARDGATTIFTLRTSDGAIMTFRPMGSLDCADQSWNGSPRRCAYISEMIQPDGTKLSFDYAYNAGASGNRARLRRVTSSRGYALILEGSGSLITKACALNLAYATLPANGLCPANAPAASYSYASGTRPALASVTGPGGGVSSFTYSASTTPSGVQIAMGFIKPGQTLPWLTNSLSFHNDEEAAAQEIVDQQSFADGQSYTYSYSMTPITDGKPEPTIAGGHFIDAQGHTNYVTFDFPIVPGTDGSQPCTELPCSVPGEGDFLHHVYQQTSGPISVTDQLGRATLMDYCDPAVSGGSPPMPGRQCAVMPLQWFIDPEGIRTELKYGDSNNIIEVRRKAKSGSGLPDIVTSATYDYCYAMPKSCTRPTSTTDSRGNVSNFSYSPDHGGILSETMPADANGVRAQKRYIYAQRSAWIQSGGGGYVPGASPIWLLTEERTCRTTATVSGTCAGGTADEVVTSFDYGPDSGPNNLLLRGKVVTADGVSLRTCYGYDATGNKISETSPRAGLAVCS